MNFSDYTNKVINRYGLRGQNAVARELNITSASMSNLMSGKILPSEETMIKLADLAGYPKEEALIDLNLWRSKNDPKRHEIWLRISKMIGCTSLAALISVNACFNSKTIASDENFNQEKYTLCDILSKLKNFVNKVALYFTFLNRSKGALCKMI